MMEDWLTAAMTDEAVVAELLLRLKQSQASVAVLPVVIPLRWGLRLPRSRPGTTTTTTTSSTRCDVVLKGSSNKDGDTSTRCSPTTPLSWSGGGDGGDASPSATGDGFEETSRNVSGDSPPPDVRSKCIGIAEATSTKRSRKKKTFSELREEESQLMKERVHLNKELATMRATFEEQRVRNENLKRIKIDLNSQYANEPVCSQIYQRDTSPLNNVPSMLPTHARGDHHLQATSFKTDKGTSNHDRSFFLPDLNVMPSDEDSGAETLYGLS